MATTKKTKHTDNHDVIQVTVTLEQKAAIAAAAAKDGDLPLSTFLRMLGLKRADELGFK